MALLFHAIQMEIMNYSGEALHKYVLLLPPVISSSIVSKLEI